MKQTEYFGAGSIKKLTEVLAQLKAANIFLVSGKKSFSASGAESILKELLKDHSVTFFNDISGDPLIEDIIKGMDSFIESDCDIVIAVGGGSVIDTAKSVNILSSQEVNPRLIINGSEKILNKGKPLIAIPTTSGAGSEATHFAVVYMEKEKYSLAHEFILPEFSIVDPELTFILSKEITATSGIDAFSQAVESFWNINANEESRNYSEEAITLILENLKIAVNAPTEGCRINMSKAAHLSGKAINITKTTAPHAVSYTMTSYFGIPHGQAVCVTLAEFLEFNINVTESDLTEGLNLKEVRKNNDDLLKILKCKNASEGKEMINELIQSIGLKTKLSDLNIKTPEDLKIISENVNLERLKNNPRYVRKEDLDKMLRNIFN